MGLFKPNIEKLSEKKDVSGLIKALDHKDPEIRTAAAKALGGLRDGMAVVSLVACLRDRELKVWQEAAEALAKIGEPSVDPLANLIRFSHPLRRVAIKTLGKIGSESAVNQLIAAMGSSDVYVREAVADALGKIGGEKVLEPLIRAFMDADGSVRKTATDGLVKLGKPAIASLCDVVKNSIRPEHIRRAAALTVEKIGGSDDLAVQAWCAVAKRDWNLGASLGEVSVEPLIYAFEERSVRAAVTDALGKIGGERVAKPLIRAFKDDNWSVHKAATDGLLKLGKPAIAPLCDVVKDSIEPEYIRWAAALTVEKIGGSDDPVVQAWCAVAKRDWNLGVSLGEVSVEPLIKAFKDTDWSVREAASEGLLKLGKPSIAPLCDVVKDSMQPEDIRWAAALTVEKIGGSDDPVVQAWYAVAKRDWKLALSLDEVSVEPLIRAFTRSSASLIVARDSGLLKALVTTGAASVVFLINILRHRDDPVRRTAAEVLGEIFDSRSVSALLDALRDEDEWVRRCAAMVLVRMYRSNRLDGIARGRIVAMRNAIEQPHYDSDCWGGATHTDASRIDFSM